MILKFIFKKENTQMAKNHSPVVANLKPAAKRISASVADHTIRLSDPASDSDAMKAFLADGGDIIVLSTRNAKGLKKSRARVSAGGSNRAEKSRRAHTSQDRNARNLRTS